MTAFVHHRRDSAVTPVVDRRQVTSRLPSDSPPRPRRAEIDAGVRSMLPWLVGVVPFGMVVGMKAGTSDVSTAVGLATGSTIYSGSAQLTAIGLLDSGADVVVVVLSVLAINARLLFYGSSIAPHWRGTSRRFRAIAAYLLVDPSYAVGMHGYRDTPARGHTYYVAAGLTLWIAWHAAMIGGLVVGGEMDGWLGLDHAVPLFLLAELVHATRSRPGLAAAGLGGIVAVAGTNLPLHSGLLVAIAAGVGAGVAVERRRA